MKRPGSIRRMLLVEMSAFTITAVLALVGVLALFFSLQSRASRELAVQLEDHRVADEIVMSVYGQLLAIHRQIERPTDFDAEQFRSLGEAAHRGVQSYLFRDMSLKGRLQVEVIKQLHERLEVDAHQAFALAVAGEEEAAQGLVADLEPAARELEGLVDSFIIGLEQEHALTRSSSALFYRGWIALMVLVIAGLIARSFHSVRVIERRLAQPLRDLTRSASQIGTGNLDSRVQVPDDTEMRTVARSFNAMASAIQRARLKIERQNTDLSKAMTDLRSTQQELVQQEKLSAIGLMLAGLAHELNNPLAGIQGNAELLLADLEIHPDPSMNRAAEEVVKPLLDDTRRAGTLVRNLLGFSRSSDTRVTVVDLKGPIELAASLRSFAFVNAGLELKLDIPDGLPVLADVQRLEHTAMNLMTNALDAMVSGGGTRLLVSARRDGEGRAVVTFQDDGPGFQNPERIFDAFYTTKPVGTGTGLGLTLVHRFLTEMGGTITAGNGSNGGAFLSISLPLSVVEQDGAPALKREVANSSTNLAGIRILVVEDEPTIRQVQRRLLERMGVNVTLADSGESALELLGRSTFDAVVTDIRMPGSINGIALHAWLSENHPGLASRCLFVTGDTAGEQTPDGGRIAPSRMLIKPFTIADYSERIRMLMDGYARSE